MCAALPRRDTHLAAEWLQRDLDALPFIEPCIPVFPISNNVFPLRIAHELPHFQSGFRELVREEAEPWDQRGPSPIPSLKPAHVDAEGVAWLGAGDVYGAVHLVQLREVERGESGGVGRGSDLAVGGVKTVESDCVSGGNVYRRRDANLNSKQAR